MLKSLWRSRAASLALLGTVLLLSSSASALSALSCPQCPCDSGVNYLRLRYDGPDGATVRVEDDDGAVVIFNAVLNNGDVFDLNGSVAPNNKFIKNALGFFVNDVADTDINVSCGKPIGVGFIFGSFVVVEFASVKGGLVTETCQPSCPCEGGVTFLRMRYSGSDGVQVRVENDNSALVLFNGILNDGDTFELNGTAPDGKFAKNTLRFFVDNVLDADIHVSCSQPIGTGFVFGAFTIEAFTSRDAGFFDEPCPATCICSGGVTFLRMSFDGVSGSTVSVVDNSGTIFGPSALNSGDEFELYGSRFDGKFDGNSLEFFVNGGPDTNVHVSCSQPIDIGFVFGSFTVRSLASRNGGLCVEGCCGDNIRDVNEECDGTADSACPGLCSAGCECTICVPNCAGKTCGDDGCGSTCGSCDDGDVCNGLETCDQTGLCLPGTPLSCDDGVTCTKDACDPITGCSNTTADTNCDDGDVCNGAETCDAVNGCQPGTPLICDDLVGCTKDACDPTTGCFAVATDANCDDNDVCNGAETCDAINDCQPGTPLICDDAIGCTKDACDPATGCFAVATDANCDDDDVCNGAETCDAINDCQPGTPLICDDTVGCTKDACDPATGCFAVATDANCDDNDICNGAETCDAVNDCQPGAPLICDDLVGCTKDACDPATGCFAVATDANCDDNDVCNGAETCDAINDCQPGAPLICDDGLACTGVETCDAVNGCQPGNQVVCDDNTVACDGPETCEEPGGICVSGPDLCDAATERCCENSDTCVPTGGCCDDSECDDGLACTGVETCDSVGVCQPGISITCPDNTLACDGPEICQEPFGDCESGPDLCDAVTERCCELTDTCVPTGGCCNDAECDDGDPCTGTETCAGGACQPGDAVICEDNGLDCDGPEACNSASGLCESGPPLCDAATQRCCEESNTCVPTGGCCNDGECDDGLACTGIETCDANGACQPGTDVKCNDNGSACDGPESCQEPGGTCASGPNLCGATERCCEALNSCVPFDGCCGDGECDDGDICTTDTCPVSGVCVNAQDKCNPIDACHTAVCNSANGGCTQTPIPGCCLDPAECDDSDACTVDDCLNNACSHVSTAGCCTSNAQCGDADSCTTDTCVDNACVHDPIPDCPDEIPTVSEWGLLALALLLLTGAKVCYGRRRGPDVVGR